MSNYFFFRQRNWTPSTQKTHDKPKALFNVKESIRTIKKRTKLLEKSLSFSTNARIITFRLLYFYMELNTSFCLIHTHTHTQTCFFYPLNLVPYTSIMLFSFGLTNINEEKVPSLTTDPLRTVCNHVFSSPYCMVPCSFEYEMRHTGPAIRKTTNSERSPIHSIFSIFAEAIIFEFL